MRSTYLIILCAVAVLAGCKSPAGGRAQWGAFKQESIGVSEESWSDLGPPQSEVIWLEEGEAPQPASGKIVYDLKNDGDAVFATIRDADDAVSVRHFSKNSKSSREEKQAFVGELSNLVPRALKDSERSKGPDGQSDVPISDAIAAESSIEADFFPDLTSIPSPESDSDELPEAPDLLPQVYRLADLEEEPNRRSTLDEPQVVTSLLQVREDGTQIEQAYGEIQQDASTGVVAASANEPQPTESFSIPTFKNEFPDSTELLGEQPIWSQAEPEGLQQEVEGGRQYFNVSLHEAIRQALESSPVLSDIGGRLLQSSSSVTSIHDPTVQASDPRFGVEGALSEFDAQLRARAFFEKNDQVLNNEILGGGVNLFRQDLWRIQAELSKKAATGTQFAIRHNIQDDLNNATRNLFPRAFDWNSEVEIRHPMLQGGGVRFNRISGRSLTPGVSNGVAIAQVNNKMSIVDFQLALRDYLSNIENAYWDLVLAYRTLDAKKSARDRTLATWQILKNLAEEGVVNRDKVDQALEQYFRLKEDVENAFYGRPAGGTRGFNGTSGGALQAESGVLVAERRLRLILGMPLDEEIILRPITEPPVAHLAYDLHEATRKALENRGELELQHLQLSKNAMELESDQNYLLPKLDMVARYRLRGLGDNLYDAYVPDSENPLDSASSRRHEWMVGAEVSYPLGFRQGHTAVRNSRLRLAREQAILSRMQQHLMHDVGNALSNKTRAFNVMRAARNRWEAAYRRYEYLTDKDVQAAKKMDFTLILDADRKLAESEVSYHRACVDYALSLKNIHFEMGTLFGYCDVHLAAL